MISHKESYRSNDDNCLNIEIFGTPFECPLRKARVNSVLLTRNDFTQDAAI